MVGLRDPRWERPFEPSKNTLTLYALISLSNADRKPTLGSEYVNMQMKCKVSLQRKRFHAQSFESASLSPGLYPLPRGKWIRWPGLDGLWSATPGRADLRERSFVAVVIWVEGWRRGEVREIFERVNKEGMSLDLCLCSLLIVCAKISLVTCIDFKPMRVKDKDKTDVT